MGCDTSPHHGLCVEWWEEAWAGTTVCPGFGFCPPCGRRQLPFRTIADIKKLRKAEAPPLQRALRITVKSVVEAGNFVRLFLFYCSWGAETGHWMGSWSKFAMGPWSCWLL